MAQKVKFDIGSKDSSNFKSKSEGRIVFAKKTSYADSSQESYELYYDNGTALIPIESESANQAKKLTNTVYIDGMLFEGDISIGKYAVCSTAAGTAAKAATIPSISGSTVRTGTIVNVKFTNANTAANPTLNISSTGAKPIYWKGAALTSDQYWTAGDVVNFVFDGTNWVVVGAIKSVDTNTWKANTSSSEGYVASGSGQANKVWKTDSNGNPGWRTDSNDNTWKANTSSSEGYVASGEGQANKVWKTDSSGSPAWRVDSNDNTTYDLSAPVNKTNGNVTLDLKAGGSGSGTDSVAIKGSDATTVTTDSTGVITISSTDTNTWKQNTSSSEGYVTKGEGNPNKVWKTNSTGTPGWRYDSNFYYGVCDTASDDPAKIVKVDDSFTLTTGAVVIVKFLASNGIANPTLNVNETGAKSIYRYGTTAASTSTTVSGWTTGAVQMFIYDGNGWIRDYWSNTTYSNASLGQGYATCSTAAATLAKVGSLSSYSLTTGGIVSVKFTYDVPASATLNINSKGAKNIYYRGSAISAGIIKAGDVATFIYSSQYHLISIDRWGIDISTIKTKLDGIASGAEVNQNAFSNVKVGSTIITADTKTDTLELVGSNVTLTPDANNDKLTIEITKNNVTAALGYTPPTQDTDTKDTAGAEPLSDTKLFLVGAPSQGVYPKTYTNASAYIGTDGCLYSGGLKVATQAELSTAMVFKGTLGTSGTRVPDTATSGTKLEAASNSNIGDTYKAITAGTYAKVSVKIGDVLVSDGTSWILIPSGDEPSGTVTSITPGVGLRPTTAITTSGTIDVALQDENKKSAVATSSTSTQLYAVGRDTNGDLAVAVPWTDTNTWQKNTVTQDGYVTAPTTANANKVWKTDASGVPGWRADADTNTWKANTSASEGFVANPNGAANMVWKTDSSGSPGWRDDANTTYSQATSDILGLVKIGYTASGKNYPVQLDSNGKMYVNVPWTDNNTWKQNTSAQDGYVTKGEGNANKVWKTDSSGNPAWRDDANTDTKNTAGASSTTSKIYLIGATSQDTNPQTYSQGTTYVAADATLHSTGFVVNEKVTMQYNATDECLEFIFN